MQLKFFTGLFVKPFLINGARRCHSTPKWDIFAALCLERRPCLVPEMNIIEKTMYNLTLQYEKSKSLLSDHEVRLIRDKERLERLASGVEVSSEDFDAASLETAQEFEDRFTNELAKLEFSPKKTKDDETNNTRSLNRCLERRLLFFANMKIGTHEKWTLPMIKVDKQSSLREAIDQLVVNLFPGNQMNLKILGKSPLAVYTYKYGKENREAFGAIGSKVFILKGYHLDGNPVLTDSNKSFISDFQWLTIDEAKKIIPKKYWWKIRSSYVIDHVEPWVLERTMSIIARRKEEVKKSAARI